MKIECPKCWTKYKVPKEKKGKKMQCAVCEAKWFVGVRDGKSEKLAQEDRKRASPKPELKSPAPIIPVQENTARSGKTVQIVVLVFLVYVLLNILWGNLKPAPVAEPKRWEFLESPHKDEISFSYTVWMKDNKYVSRGGLLQFEAYITNTGTQDIKHADFKVKFFRYGKEVMAEGVVSVFDLRKGERVCVFGMATPLDNKFGFFPSEIKNWNMELWK